MAEWFKDWFNSKYYHILYKDRNLEEAKGFIQNLIDHISLEKGAKVLDLACGRGRHSIFLNECGFDVLGVDLAEHNIEFAKQFENDQLKFKVHDMRDPLNNYQFDAVLNLFTSFGYFNNSSDNDKVLGSVASYLKLKGILIIDFFNVQKIIDHLQGHFEKDIEGVHFRIDKHFDGKFIHKKIRVEDGDHIEEYEEVVQAILLKDLEEMLEKAGFVIEEVFGDYNLSNFDAVNSDRLIIKATLK